MSEALRAVTQARHAELEATDYVKALLSKRITRIAYARYLRDLHLVYQALEAPDEAADSPGPITMFLAAGLARTEAIAADLCSLVSAHWVHELPPAGQAACAYAEHLRILRTHAPVRMLGHAYTRYFGDLSGGQLLAQQLRSALGLSDQGGTRYHAFARQPQQLKQELKAGLDQLPLSQAAFNAVVQETGRAYDLSLALLRAANGAAPALPGQ